MTNSHHHPLDAVLRDARESDIPGLLALETASFTTDRLDARAFRRFLRGPSSGLVLADDGIAMPVAGYALVLFRSNSRVARLYSIAVAARSRGKGLGEKLLIAAEQITARRNCRSLRLEVRPDNAAAIALYRRRGYLAIGRYPSFYEDGSEALRFEGRIDTGSDFAH